MLRRSVIYALRAMHCLSRMETNGRKSPIASHEVAQTCAMPERFLLKVLHPLVVAGILAATKGPSGGYRLQKKLHQVTVAEVARAIEGEEVPTVGPDEVAGELRPGLEALAAKLAQKRAAALQVSVASLE